MNEYYDIGIKRANLERLARLDGGAGTTSVVRILEGDGADMLSRCREEQKKLTEGLHEQGLEAFVAWLREESA